MPTYGTTFNEGVKYLKINKFDTNGTDKSDYLAQMSSIRINYGDIGTLQYNVATTQVQNDYFVFGLSNPQPRSSSLGDINDYGFKATTSTISSVINTFYYTASNFTINSGNSLNNLNSSSGVYGLTQTPNTQIQFVFTASIAPTTPKTLAFALIDNNFTDGESPYIASTSFTVPAGPGADVIRSGSIILDSNSIPSVPFVEGALNLGIGFFLSAGTGFIVANLTVTASNVTPAFNGSSSLIDFDPDQINFDYNDYNPLLDNAEIPQYSTSWMDVDYSQNPLTPVNFILIISGTADRAFVQDSNYSSKAWSNLRYNGSRTNSFRNI